MISRYTRKPVAQNLHIRGVSHSTLDQHPPPEDPQQECTLSHRLLQDLQLNTSTCNSSSSSSSALRSVCPSAVAVETSRTWSVIDSYTGTGVSTERSSVFSWAYDEFDKAASRQVQQLFEEIDEELYEGRGGEQQDECKLWASRFPHLRILGKQLVCPTDEGFQWISTSPQSSSSTTHRHNKQSELCVQGHRAALCVEVTHPTDPGGDELPRVIEEEGVIEEYLAFDWRDLDDECVCMNRRKHFLPPVSPYRCRREAVLELLFDDVWRELIGWMEELLPRLWEGSGSDEEKSVLPPSPEHHQFHSPSGLNSSTPCTLPRLGPLTQNPPNTLHTPNSKLRSSKSRRRSKKLRKPSTSSRGSLGSGAVQHNTLTNLIVVHGIPLQQRHSGPPERSSHDVDERLGPSKPRHRHTLEQSPSPVPRPPPSSRRRPLPPRTLLPLNQSGSAAGNMEEGIIRGTRIAPASDYLSSSVVTLSRNTLLPPISTTDPEHTHSGHQTRPSQRHRGPSSRAHSAVADEVCGVLPFSRPNTTHTFRSDTPHRRSFTVLDSSGQVRPSRASVCTDSLGIGVTGISLGISSSSFLDSFTHHAHDHAPIVDGEEPEAQAPPPALLLPVSLPSHSRGLITRTNRTGL
ncbi:protein FAM149B1 isoform X2 [Trichomycterus rosablanca]|uniref:protein FAM149B1 isoform X2 n=1 Tax=Trichomycterus rosablanca TaxID=2290929 RepID=UPI002F357136